MNNEMYKEVDDLKEIRKHYGEKMSHLCRDLFPTILEKKGLLFHIIETHFARSKQLYEDIMSERKELGFKTYIYSIYDEINNTNSRTKIDKSARELLSEKGYTLYECKNNEDIQKFRKYYKKNEELCTFRDPYRINSYHIFFIVKDNANELKREDFSNPKREDEYSVSVLDLQIDKGKRQRVSIKSRYNHTVTNPDATYSNNLDNIAEGLTEAFEKEYGFNIGNEYKENFELENYVLASDNKYYKYNYEINNIHYCPNNVIIDNGRIIDTYKDQGRYILVDYFIIDRKEKKITFYDERIKDSFLDGLTNITSIEVTKEEGQKKIVIHQGEKESTIKIDVNGKIISYENKNLTSCGYDFLYWNKSLQELNLPNLQSCGNYFLYHNGSLRELNLPNLQSCGSAFLYWNESLQELDLPNLQYCGGYFLYHNKSLQELNLPNLQSCGNNFLFWNESLQELNLPNLQSCENNFLYCNKSLQELNLPNLQSCGNGFLCCNESLQELNLPNLQSCEDRFLNNHPMKHQVFKTK